MVYGTSAFRTKRRELTVTLVLIWLVVIPPLPYGFAQQRIKPELVVIVVVDGFSNSYINALGLDQFPNIRSLTQNGLYFPNAWVGHLASSTVVSHPVIEKGVYPKRFGIVDYAWRDPTTLEVVDPSADSFTTDGKMREVMVAANTPSISYWVKQEYPGAVAAAISTKLYAVSGLEPDFDIIIGGLKANVGGVDTLVPGYKPRDYLMNITFPWSDRKKLDDEWVVDLAIQILRKEHPRVMLLNLPLVDTWGHRTLGPASLDKMKPWLQNADKQIGRLVDEMKSEGIYDKTLIVVTADHGMVPGYWTYAVQSISDPIEKAGIRVAAVAGYNIGDIWLRNMTQAKQAAEALAQANPEGIKSIYYKVNDPVVGYRFIPETNPSPLFDELAQTAACFSGPDVMAFNNEYTIQYYEGYPSDHGGAQWLAQNVPLIFSGPGIPKNVSYMTAQFAGPRLRDIAPTVLYLMGIPGVGGVTGEYKMDGRVLREELNMASVMAGEVPSGPQGPPGQAAPIEALIAAVVLSVAAVIISVYALASARRKRAAS